MSKIHAYIRVSTDKQVQDGDGLDIQDRQIRGYAMTRGWDIAETIVEDGVSGRTPVADRPAAGPVFAKKGDVVVAAKLDRLFRRASDALNTVEALQRKGVAVHVTDLGELTNGVSKLFLTIVAAFAEEERRVIGERTKSAKAHQRKLGRFLGGRAPFGYRAVPVAGERSAKDLVEDPAEQAVLVEMRQLKAQGKSLRAIAQTMRARGIRISHVGVESALRHAS
jgi:putative DNA-invertase from lambdoid prophage Rac